MKNATINKGIIKKIARALGELNEQVVYVGGATVGLYINDPAADDVAHQIMLVEKESFLEILIAAQVKQTHGLGNTFDRKGK